jgi:soluble lytic murein transglycosylase-like protein
LPFFPFKSEFFPFSSGKAVFLAMSVGLWLPTFWRGDANAAVAGKAHGPMLNQGNSMGGSVNAAPREFLRDTAWWTVAEQRGLDPYILYAVALVESAKVSKRLAKPWPWALNRQGRPVIPSSLTEAKDILGGSLAKGIRNIDVGLMQVNVRWQGHRVRQPEDLLDPEINLRVGADILFEAIGSATGNLVLGIGRYHAGFRDAERAYRYGRRVLAVAQQIRWLI